LAVIPEAFGPFRSIVTVFVSVYPVISYHPGPEDRYIRLPTIAAVKPPVAEVTVVFPVHAASATDNWALACCE
jgi:hypothetical protein